MAGPARGLAAHTLLAFDYGHRRIGVAVGDAALGTASALTTVTSLRSGPDWQALTALVTTWKPRRLLVGQPLNMDGTRSALTDAAEAFARNLGERCALPVELIDERLSSFEARDQLREQRRGGLRGRRVRRAQVDSEAAAVILRSWLARAHE